MTSKSELSIQWFKGYSDKEGLKNHLLNSGNVLALQRLIAVLDDKLKDLERQEMSKEVLFSPNWPNIQANILGQKHSINWVKDLLSFVQTKGK